MPVTHQHATPASNSAATNRRHIASATRQPSSRAAPNSAQDEIRKRANRRQSATACAIGHRDRLDLAAYPRPAPPTNRSGKLRPAYSADSALLHSLPGCASSVMPKPANRASGAAHRFLRRGVRSRKPGSHSKKQRATARHNHPPALRVETCLDQRLQSARAHSLQAASNREGKKPLARPSAKISRFKREIAAFAVALQSHGSLAGRSIACHPDQSATRASEPRSPLQIAASMRQIPCRFHPESPPYLPTQSRTLIHQANPLAPLPRQPQRRQSRPARLPQPPHRSVCSFRHDLHARRACQLAGAHVGNAIHRRPALHAMPMRRNGARASPRTEIRHGSLAAIIAAANACSLGTPTCRPFTVIEKSWVIRAPIFAQTESPRSIRDEDIRHFGIDSMIAYNIVFLAHMENKHSSASSIFGEWVLLTPIWGIQKSSARQWCGRKLRKKKLFGF